MSRKICIPTNKEIELESIDHICIWDARRGLANQAIPAHIPVPDCPTDEYLIFIFLKDGCHERIVAEDSKDYKGDYSNDLLASQRRELVNNIYSDIVKQMGTENE